MTRARLHLRSAAATAAALLLSVASIATAQPPPGTALDDPLATRAELEALADSLRRSPAADSAAALLRRVQQRLAQGDFRPGDRILLQVIGEPALTDTFSVEAGPQLRLPPPTLGILPLEGILRAEFEPRVAEYVARFLQDPLVRARPLLRVSVQGEVTRAGYYEVPADAVLSHPLMAAGGTTPRAEMDKLRIERDGEPLWEGGMLRDAIAAGRTLADALLRDGDQYTVPRREDGGFVDRLRFLWVVVSLAGGVYGLTRAF